MMVLECNKGSCTRQKEMNSRIEEGKKGSWSQHNFFSGSPPCCMDRGNRGYRPGWSRVWFADDPSTSQQPARLLLKINPCIQSIGPAKWSSISLLPHRKSQSMVHRTRRTGGRTSVRRQGLAYQRAGSRLRAGEWGLAARQG